ncbi:MAG: DNA mismatch repair endonuclease MutL [Pseudomonadota bacterium]
MQRSEPKIGEKRPIIRQLDEAAVNRIAAGEVIERPASAVKELIENALDAGAARIGIDIADGGKTLIRVSDDGCGMDADDLPLALARHATSKIDGSDLLNIQSFGFRGEALASLGAVGRLTIASRTKDTDPVEVSVTGGKMGPIRPAALNQGTVVTLRDLFFATPARLKFMRSDRAETQAINNVVKRMAMAEPFVSFTLRDISGERDPRMVFRAYAETGDLFDALHRRLAQVLGSDFAENALRIDAEREGLQMTGYAALPTYSRGAATAQYLFVNGRPVRDRMLLGALRAAYNDFLSRDRHPVAVLFIDCHPTLVDVNVHPAKAEVRFRDPGTARGLIVSGLRHALAEAGHRASTTVAGAALGAMRPEPSGARVYQMDRPYGLSSTDKYAASLPAFAEAQSAFSGRVETDAPSEGLETDQAYPLGAARAQLHENYIVAQTENGMVIVDQHAAHERLAYEKLKAQMEERGVAAQALLIPEIVELSEAEASLLLSVSDDLEQLGLGIESFGPGSIAVRETPAVLGPCDAAAMLRDILDELADMGRSESLRNRIDAILSRVACHGSIRSGRRMRGDEMNALLREMEATPHSGQCNHGRPTYVELPLADIERLFGRR